MITGINEHRLIRFKEVFEPIELVSTEGLSLTICMRDGGFEIGIEDVSATSPTVTWYSIQNGTIEPMVMEDKG